MMRYDYVIVIAGARELIVTSEANSYGPSEGRRVALRYAANKALALAKTRDTLPHIHHSMERAFTYKEYSSVLSAWNAANPDHTVEVHEVPHLTKDRSARRDVRYMGT